MEFHVLFNHRGKQRKTAFTDESFLQSALNFLCPIEEMIFFGNATFDADGWPNYSPVSEHAAAKWGRLQSIWFVQKTTIAQTSQPSLMFLYKAEESRGLWDEQKLWNQEMHAAPIVQGRLTRHLPDQQKQNKWLAEHLACTCPILAPITAY